MVSRKRRSHTHDGAEKQENHEVEDKDKSGEIQISESSIIEGVLQDHEPPPGERFRRSHPGLRN